MTAAICSASIFAQAILGCGFSKHTARPVTITECCDTCGVRGIEVAEKIQVLQSCPKWRQRDNAAHALRRYEWECHPEILFALATALQTDCSEEVREEAAETLAKLSPAPCVPEVHEALARAAKCDPDHATRKWARRAVVRLDEGCRAECAVCEQGQAGYVVERPVFPSRVYALPRNGAYVVPGSRMEVPISPPPIVFEPEWIQEAPAPVNEADPLNNLPHLESLPAPLNPEPSIPPPPPIETSPFESSPRADRRFDSTTARLESRDRSRGDSAERIARRDQDDERDDSKAGRRRLFPFSLLGRRGR
jgi:hypothetical protein